MPATLEKWAASLRGALAAERFPQAQSMATGYARALYEQWRALAPGDPEAARLQRQAEELWQWARHTALAQRAQLAAHLEAIQPLATYFHGRSRERHTFEMRG